MISRRHRAGAIT